VLLREQLKQRSSRSLVLTPRDKQVMERLSGDENGYDCVWVDAKNQGNFVSLISHSCAPNAIAHMVSAGMINML